MDLMNLFPFRKKNITVRREEEHPLSLMQREMNRMFDSFVREWGFGAFPGISGEFIPRVDVSEDAKEFTVTVELPGMDEKDIDVSIADDSLTIRGEKKDEREDKGKNYYYAERSYGTFSRTIPLPAGVNEEKVSATFRKGVLAITLPKTAAVSAKKIPVRIE